MDIKNLISAELLKHIAVSIAVIVAAIVVWHLFKKAYKRYMETKGATLKSSNPAIGTFTSALYGILKALIIIIVALIVLQINGVNVSSLLAGLGIAGAVVGLAFQDMLKDIIMGVHILADDFFKLGDIIEYEGTDWEVVSYNVRTTKLRSLADGGVKTVSNRNFSEIKKISGDVYLSVPLPYEEDFMRIHEIFTALAEEISALDEIKWCRYFGTQELGDSAISYLFGISGKPEAVRSTRRLLLKAVQERLNKEGISVPYNKLDVNIIKE